jgi:hypothetical protein
MVDKLNMKKRKENVDFTKNKRTLLSNKCAIFPSKPQLFFFSFLVHHTLNK